MKVIMAHVQKSTTSSIFMKWERHYVQRTVKNTPNHTPDLSGFWPDTFSALSSQQSRALTTSQTHGEEATVFTWSMWSSMSERIKVVVAVGNVPGVSGHGRVGGCWGSGCFCVRWLSVISNVMADGVVIQSEELLLEAIQLHHGPALLLITL